MNPTQNPQPNAPQNPVPAPQGTPPSNPQGPAPQPEHQYRSMTAGEKIKVTLFAAFFLIIGGALIMWNINDNNKINDLKENGVRTTGTLTTERGIYEFTDRDRRSSTVKYKARYEYTRENADGTSYTSHAIGEKAYETEEEIEGYEGRTADIYYDPADAGKGTYTENEP